MRKADVVAIKEGVKELLRTALIAVVPILIVQFESGTVEWKVILTAGLVALFRGLDKWLHEADKGLTDHKGLVPF